MNRSPYTQHALEVAATMPAAVLADARLGRSDPDARDRAIALCAAVGHLLRLADALAATSDDGGDAHRAAAPACLALRRASSLLPEPSEVVLRLQELALRVHEASLDDPATDEDDPAVAAERLEELEEADRLLAVLAGLSHVRGQPVPPGAVPASLRIGRRLSRGLSRSTWWRVEAAAAAEASERLLYADPVGRALWVSLLEPDRRAELTSPAADAEQELERLAAHGPGEDGRTPGEIGLLLYDERRKRAIVVPLQIRERGGARVWGRDAQWGDTALHAVRMGYLAAAREVFLGVPPLALEDHHVHIDAGVHVDGDSLGLAIAIALVSLWTRRGVPHGTSATGVIRADGRVAPVSAASLAAKVEAAFDQYQKTSLVLVPAQPEAPAGTLRCDTLGAALEACGLDRQARPPPATQSSLREDQLRSAMNAVDRQDLTRVPEVAGGSPWALLGDTIALLVESFDGDPPQDIDLRSARMKGALAWLHAGELDLAGEALRLVEDGELPADLQVMKSTLALAAAIDRADPGQGQAADAALADLLSARSDTGPVVHLALGTRGRWRVHMNEPQEGLPLLEWAADIAPGPERARSLVYLGQGLRCAGRLGEAEARLAQARGELAVTRKRSEAYAESTRCYLEYEAARVALGLGRPADAAASAQAALRLAAPGFWPRAGILRVLAQAARAAGDAEGAAEAQRQLERWVALAPQAYRPLMQQILAEAAGTAPGPPVVY